MRWTSKWSDGFPGWHMECSAMGIKYLGEKFDIHGGGMDLLFPHHECEIAQSTAALGFESVKYWLHNNMITINGQKMGKSLGNFINLEEFFNGSHKLLTQAYSPMTIRFFLLQAHYRSTLDFSNEALQAAEKGLARLMNAYNAIEKLKVSEKSTVSINLDELNNNCFEAMNDDLNSPIVISYLFEAVKTINLVIAGNEQINQVDIDKLKTIFNTFVIEVLGLLPQKGSTNEAVLNDVINLMLNLRMEAKSNKNFELSDKIRNELNKIGIEIKDKKDGFDWSLKT